MERLNIIRETRPDMYSTHDAGGKLYLRGKWLIEESTSEVWREYLLR